MVVGQAARNLLGGAASTWGAAKTIGWRGVRQAVGAAWANPYGRAGMVGMGAGAGWGMLGDDTSVVGGALLGGMAGVGGLGAFRYGRAALGAVGGAPMGVGMAGAAGRAMRTRWGRDVRDFHSLGATLQSNIGYRRVRQSLKNWNF